MKIRHVETRGKCGRKSGYTWDRWSSNVCVCAWTATTPMSFFQFPMAASIDMIAPRPIMLVHGDMDTVVPVTVGRAWAEAMKSIPMKNYQYIEVAGGDHGTVIGSHQAELFAFFARHSR